MRAGRLECEMARGQDGLTDVAQETRAGACRFFLMSCGCGCVWGVLRGSSFSLRPSSPSHTQLFLPLQICLLVAVGSEALRERGRARLKTGREKRGEKREERGEGRGKRGRREGEERLKTRRRSRRRTRRSRRRTRRSRSCASSGSRRCGVPAGVPAAGHRSAPLATSRRHSLRAAVSAP